MVGGRDWARLGPVFLALAINLPSVRYDLTFDDTRAILANPDVLGTSPLSQLWLNDFWGLPLNHSGSHKSYRPLCVLSFRINHQLDGLNPRGFHLVNAVLHAVNVLLLGALTRRLCGPSVSSTTCWLFASHPVHCEAVASVVGRAELGSCLFGLLAVLVYTRKERSANRCPQILTTVALVAIAMLWKEQGITFLGICICLTFLDYTHMKASFTPLTCLVAAAASLAYARVVLMGSQPPSFSQSDNPVAAEPIWLTRTMSFCFLPLYNFYLMMCPAVLSFDWSMDSIPLVSSLSDPRNACSLVFYVLLLYLAVHCAREALAAGNVGSGGRCCLIGMMFMVLPFLPSTNLLFYVGFVVAERVLYSPSIGYCVLVACGVEKLRRRHPDCQRLILSMFMFVVTALSVRSVLRNEVWLSEQSLYKSGVGVNPAKSFSNLGNVYTQLGDFRSAELSYLAALAHRGNMGDTHYNLGVLYHTHDLHDRAVLAYSHALKYRPYMTVVHWNLGLCLERLGRAAEAELVYRDALKQSGEGVKDQLNFLKGRINSCYHLGKLLYKQGHYESGELILRRCLEIRPSFFSAATIYNLLAECLKQLGRSDREILSVLETAVASDERNIISRTKLGLHLIRTDAPRAALEQFLAVVNLSPSPDYSAYHNVADVYRLMGEAYFGQSEEYFRLALAQQPSAIAHMNLGAILHMRNKYTEAHDEYLTALGLDPDNQVLKDNLKKLKRLMQKG